MDFKTDFDAVSPQFFSSYKARASKLMVLFSRGEGVGVATRWVFFY